MEMGSAPRGWGQAPNCRAAIRSDRLQPNERLPRKSPIRRHLGLLPLHSWAAEYLPIPIPVQSCGRLRPLATWRVPGKKVEAEKHATFESDLPIAQSTPG